MTLEQARRQLTDEGQTHLLRFWDRLDADARDRLLKQIAALDFTAIQRMREQLARSRTAAPSDTAAEIVPAAVEEMDAVTRAAAVQQGEAALRAGRVGVLLVAGGQGSRLGFEGPKGAYPIGPVSQAVLFYFHARKVLSLAQTYGVAVPFYIMTSESSDDATKACFADHGWFGLPPEDVFFFKQGMWPALDEQGRVILDAPGHIFMSPDGHGGTLAALQASGALDDMSRRGLETIFYFQVDNPLVEVADPAFIGLHLLKRADLSIKVCAKRDPHEGLGMVVQRNGRCEMVEYTEFTDAQKTRRTPAGDLYFKYGSVAIHLFQLAFIVRETAAPMPLHVAHKKIPVCDDDGTVRTPATPNGYKFEKFIFDLLPHAGTVVNVAFDRADEFSPVKNAAGADSPDTCRRDLTAKWGRWLAAAGLDVPRDASGALRRPIEIDPAFARTPEQLKARLAAGAAVNVDQPILLELP